MPLQKCSSPTTLLRQKQMTVPPKKPFSPTVQWKKKMPILLGWSRHRPLPELALFQVATSSAVHRPAASPAAHGRPCRHQVHPPSPKDRWQGHPYAPSEVGASLAKMTARSEGGEAGYGRRGGGASCRQMYMGSWRRNAVQIQPISGSLSRSDKAARRTQSAFSGCFHNVGLPQKCTVGARSSPPRWLCQPRPPPSSYPKLRGATYYFIPPDHVVRTRSFASSSSFSSPSFVRMTRGAAARRSKHRLGGGEEARILKEREV